jgi:PIN domain nuclease of toxin-antitoxin system
MKRPILLDTNVLIWALNDDRRLTRRVRTALASPVSDIRVSVVSAWEIAIKYQSGKLALEAPIEALLSRILSGDVWPVLAVLPAHITALLDLPLLHRDPFDRLLIAQARSEGMILATADAEIPKYQVPTLG